ncbi:E3 ubiquitin-protein ligase listerin-like [Hylaeus volcanicus]|uniref:E3 ubiquitin-protein ligase listerin-like n=1 Tax=Hylaeus volcanicus TaxID=313075 RepID=UPI0023B8673F|nr:E3 ubiquitin-protein ligase listerin-like [Hylaeus volcanicus]XP_053980360.1 E3 ubiquitin-protein ligase listerin-like [Hylaeus volcanicus]
MGKKKQAQRTKNNARPSSSSRSAELLGSAMPNFVGFAAVKDGGYVPVLPGLSLCSINEIEMSNIDNNFQIVLKKMNKKDATTKYKALQEFAVMCRDSELSAVEGMLPFWPRKYCALAIDVEHRVREAAQLAHAALVKRVGKGIAVYLKQLAGAWFTSQHDTYPPAASAAINSFNDTFPPRKMIDAIVHCQQEILTYICDNITIHTAQSLSLQKNLTAEEMEAKYQRVLITSLQGYSFYLKKVPVQEIEKMIDIHRKIISNSKFWKLVKYDALPVKTAFFNVLTSMNENTVILLQEEKKRTVTTIMNSLDETEPALLSAVWESVLVTINKIQDWYCVVSIEKLVLPKLWRVLRSGGQCCATIVYPNLLPFISQFPKLNVDVYNLYMNFFNNMRQGFSVKSVQMSRSEMFAVTTSFIECLRYSILLNVDNHDLCITLLKEQLMPSLEMCLKEDTPMKQILFCEITHLVRYWSKNRYNEEYKSYSYLIQEFWRELKLLFDSIIDTSQNLETFNVPYTSNSQIKFLITLKTAPVHGRKNLKVTFSNPEDDINVDRQPQDTNTDTDTVFLSELNNFVYSLCIKYFNKITEQRIKTYITYLNKLITCFANEELFINPSNSFKVEVNFFNVYNNVLRNWLLDHSPDTEYIVELIFNFMKHMNDDEKNNILESLTQFQDIVTTRSVIQCALSKKHRNDPIVKKWCSQSRITSLLVDVAKVIASGNYSDLEKNQNLILLAFEPSDDGNLSITEDGVNEIVSILCNSIHEVDKTYLLHFAKLISCIVPLTWTHKQSILGAVQVLETLFELCSRDYFSNDFAFIETMRVVWKKGLLEAIKKLSQPALIELTNKFATTMWKKIYNSNDERPKDILVDMAADFLEVIIDNQVHMDNDYAQEIILTFLTDSNITTWMAEVTGIILYGEVICGKLYVSTLDQRIQIYQNSMSIDLTSTAVMDNTENCLKWALFNINVLNNLCLRSTSRDEEEDEDKESNSEKLMIHNLNLPGSTNLLINIIYSIILGRIYTNHYKSTKYYSNVSKILITVENSFKQIQMHINEDTYNQIVNHIKINYSKYGSMLSYIILFCCTELCTGQKPEELFKIYNNSNIPITDNEMNLQGQQILSKLQSSENTSVTINDINIHMLIVARSTLINQEHNLNYSSILEKLISYKKENHMLLLFDCDVSQTSWERLTLPLEVIRLLTEFVTKVPTKLTFDQWNFILISLVLWQFSLTKSKQNANDFKVSTLTVAVCQLYFALQNLMNRHEQEEITDLPRTLLDEWKNVFASDIQYGIIKSWMVYADSYDKKTAVLKPIIVLDYLGKAVKMLNGNILFETQSKIAPSIPVDLNDTVKLSLKLFQSPVASIQLGAYHVLKQAVPVLVEQDKATVELENFDANTLNIKKIEDVLENSQNIVNTTLMDFKLCDTVSCTIQPYTDSYTYTVGYLLSWAIILDMCANAHGDLLYQYAEILKDNFFPSLLNNIFRLMPVEVLQDYKNKGAKLMELFSTEPSLDFGESWTEWRLDHIVCWLYTNSLRHLPVLVRQWWSTADSRVSAAVDKITTHYVSPMLCQEELLNTKLHTIENMQVKVHPTFREVVALYQMDDTKLELNITLPPNHPLGPVTVEPGQHAGGTANWRNCHMQLSIFLTHQNGSVWDGLALWKRNLDKKFAGVEECYICFSIFHLSTYQIPKLSCHTCRKKFHTACLYKWFSTSQKSTCPICRNVF